MCMILMSDLRACLRLHDTGCLFHTVVAAAASAADGQVVTSATELHAGDKVQQVVAVPQQVHFHVHSEHLLQGEPSSSRYLLQISLAIPAATLSG
jgi:hypothetical protein